MRRLTRLLIGLAAGVLAAGVLTGSALAKPVRPPKPPPPLRLHPRYTLAAAGQWLGLLADGRYVFLAGLSGPTAGTVIDDQTGRETLLNYYPGCGPELIGGGWLLFECGRAQRHPFELYSLASRRWRGVDYGVRQPPGTPVAIGSRWIELEYAAAGCACAPSVSYQAIGSHRVIAAPKLTSTQIVDLNSAKLVTPLCTPLHLPGQPNPYLAPLTLYPPFAVAYYGSFGRLFPQLEHCGSSAHIPLGTSTVVGSAGLLVWRAAGVFDGIFPTCLRRAEIALPPGDATPPPEFAVGPRHVYVPGTGGLWAGRLPARPACGRKITW